MSTLTSEQVSLLVIHLVRDEQVCSVSSGRLKPEHFFMVGEEKFNLIWAVTQQYFDLYSSLPPKEIILSQLSAYVALDPSLAPIVEKAKEEVELLFKFPEDSLMATFAIKQLLQPLMNERAVAPLLQNTGDVEQTVESISKEFSSTRVTGAEEAAVFDLEDERLNIKPLKAFATGSALYDCLTDGGIRPATLTGVLAAFGGGKTMLGIEAAISLAKQKKHVAIFQYEQKVFQKLQYRVWSCATGVPTSTLTSDIFRDLQEDIKDKLRHVSQTIAPYFHIFDMKEQASGGNGAAEIENIMQNFKRKGIDIEFVVVDWLGLLVRDYCAAHNLDYDNHKYGLFAQNIDHLRYQVADKFQCEVLILHQLNADAGQKKGTSRVDHYAAADYRKFGEVMDNCFILGAPDTNGVALAYNTKMRGVKNETYIRHQGNLCRFELLDGDYIAFEGANGATNFVNKSAARKIAEDSFASVEQVDVAV